jgi:putative tryptophan/tyrosine transport system substrate-binding protein
MKRRAFITLLGGAAVAWPMVARAQQEGVPVIGFLHGGSPEQYVNLVTAFRKGLSQTGYVEGQNLAIEFRWAAGQEDLLPDLAADLIRRRVAVIATAGSTPAALAAKAATTTVPVVFTTSGDPVALGLVASINRPGGNATGIIGLTVETTAKRLGLLRELMPQVSRFVVLVNPNSALTEVIVKDLDASGLGLPVEIFHASTNLEIDAVFAKFVQKPGGILMVSPDPFFVNRRTQLVTLAARYALPVIYPIREFVDIGGLMSYGPSFTNIHREAGIYTGRILKGEKPADLPVLQPTKLELVINLQTAKLLGLTVPPSLLAIADEVIE